jgi:predicted RecA/RadA family phage recombinase
MARNFIGEGEAVDLIAPYDVTAGSGALVGALFGVALNTYKLNDQGVFGTCGIWELKKTSAQAWTAGQKVYWDNTAKEVTSTAGANVLIGVAVAAAVNPSATGRVRLNGTA